MRKIFIICLSALYLCYIAQTHSAFISFGGDTSDEEDDSARPASMANDNSLESEMDALIGRTTTLHTSPSGGSSRTGSSGRGSKPQTPSRRRSSQSRSVEPTSKLSQDVTPEHLVRKHRGKSAQELQKAPQVIIETEEASLESEKRFPLNSFHDRVSRWFNVERGDTVLKTYTEADHAKGDKLIEKLQKRFQFDELEMNAYIYRAHRAPRIILKLAQQQKLGRVIQQKNERASANPEEDIEITYQPFVVIDGICYFDNFTRKELGTMEAAITTKGVCYHWHFKHQPLNETWIQGAGPEGKRIKRLIETTDPESLQWGPAGAEDIGVFIEDKEKNAIIAWTPGSDTFFFFNL